MLKMGLNILNPVSIHCDMKSNNPVRHLPASSLADIQPRMRHRRLNRIQQHNHDLAPSDLHLHLYCTRDLFQFISMINL
jgi:hypothetical protein